MSNRKSGETVPLLQGEPQGSPRTQSQYYNNKLNESTVSAKSLSQSFQQSASSSSAAATNASPATPAPTGWRKAVSGEGFKLGMLLLTVVLIGTTNRVTFKIMQYGNTNYMYFVSQFTSFIFIPIFFAVILFKRLFTNDITPDQLAFPKYKFAVMGGLDTLQGLFITVGGRNVPGMMQNLLLQGAVPVTMLASIIFLRPTGCDNCKKMRKVLTTRKISFSEQSTLPTLKCTDDECKSWASLNGTNVRNGDVNELTRVLDNEMPSTLKPQVTLYTSAQPWKEHLKSFYSVWQYVGAVIILAGLVVSVWPAVSGGDGGGPVADDMLFFTATLPTALSGVYKEIAFRSCDDMDVWYLNGWVSVFQFLLGLPLAPLAAVMSDLAVTDIPSNLWEGIECLFAAHNTIVPTNSSSSCVTFSNCTTNCCDSCDGSFSEVSALPAYGGMLMYLSANLIYNVVLVMVIKYGSAALMYVASTAVLPLGAICFTIPAFLGDHAKDFTVYDGSGLGIVLAGLIVYRFVGGLMKKRQQVPSKALISINMTEPTMIESDHVRQQEKFKPRTAARMRSDLYMRLGVQTPPPQHMRINMETQYDTDA
ncbi:hypothetical protein CAOG_04137 [Capsaspora owczarzaki ATCC 30864]|uniref:Uncharacterized protein n=1 Tax=Capsaspora owczarzaki (strain ATCC 30864) TaxID=595528 RepID=A0A0D2UE00_CAPO3|nr:hypothetical protein CAOG_04137 [Capsaspora owczarzaki ATCC 30864]KJE93331.1 hypothetical protein CAOG_004137 [Capsaspora owczarzaki ATCC 30864]|eukprot:XP_004347962.1 hypothetical protein CAOG_04137 [Capsaspora owczarzaki ATCC 30864]